METIELNGRRWAYLRWEQSPTFAALLDARGEFWGLPETRDAIVAWLGTDAAPEYVAELLAQPLEGGLVRVDIDGQGWEVFSASVFNDAEAAAICDKWMARLGPGFHPDIRGADYELNHTRRLTNAEAAAYDSDIDRLFAIAEPYEAGIAAARRAGLLGAENVAA